MGKLTEFDIIFDHPQAVYKAGEVVRGHVSIELSEPMKLRNIRIWVYGRAKVHWQKTTHSGKSTHTTHYRAEEVFIEKTIMLFGDVTNDGIMHPEGRHQYNFELPLQHNLPSSFEGEYGYVRYLCKATIDKPWKFDHDTKAAFTVISHLDLNREPQELRTAMEGVDSSEVECCCCVSGKISAKFRINKRGFVPGESIVVFAEVHNGSNTEITSTRFSLKQYVEFYGVSDSLFTSGNPKPYSVSNYVATKSRGAIPEGQTDVWNNLPVVVPPLPPSRLVGCNIINIAYVAKFYVSVNYGQDIKIACDVIIGTIPLREAFMVPGYSAVMAQPLPAPLPEPSTITPLLPPPPPGPPPPGFFDYTDILKVTLPPCPVYYQIMEAPPSYEECAMGRRDLREDNDTEYTRGQLNWAPSYPIYKQLSMEPLPSLPQPDDSQTSPSAREEENRL